MLININDNWNFYGKDGKCQNINLPHTYNAVDGQDGGNDYFRGKCRYEKALDLPAIKDGERLYLRFDGVAMSADVYIGSKKVCRHEGGYSAFYIDITDAVRESNILMVETDNGSNDRVYPQMADFTFYGGIYRNAYLLKLPVEHFAFKDGGQGVYAEATVSGDKAVVKARAYVTVIGVVEFTLCGENKKAVVANGLAEAEFVVSNPHLWNGLADPYLYTLNAKYNGQEQSVKFGCCNMYADPQKGFVLNGKSYPLRGVSRHQDRPGVGTAITEEMMAEDLALICDMGANSIRLAHYQHAQEFYDLCDERGIIVWAEIPYITSHMEGGNENTLSQMRELIMQCKNHPSIYCWGLSNEITAMAVDEELILQNHKRLQALCKELDNRPTSMAHVFMLDPASPLIDVSDVAGYNLYYGWYVGETGESGEFLDKFHSLHPEKPIALTEYGADANAALHSANPQRGDYTEEYQAIYHERMLKIISERPYLWGTFVWNMFDFAADGRDEGGAHGLNQKGLVTFDRKTKKDAYYIYKAYLSKVPFVHICGRRFVRRTGNITEIKVYSNQSEVSLYVNGKLFESKWADKVFVFDVPLDGNTVIKAVSGSLCDEITIERVDEAEVSYSLGGNGSVINWFDKIPTDSNYYSINDTFGALMANAQTAQIVLPISQGMAAARGEIAANVQDNPAVQKMMANMTLKQMFRYAGDSIKPEQVEAINAMLQKIKKG